MKKHFSWPAAGLSIFIGLLSYPMSVWYFGVRYALMFSVLITAALMIVIPFALYYEDRRYRGIEGKVAGKVLAKIKANIVMDKRPRNGYILLTDEALYLFSRDNKPYIEKRIGRPQILGFSNDGPGRIVLHFEYEQLSLLSAEVDKLVAHLPRIG